MFMEFKGTHYAQRHGVQYLSCAVGVLLTYSSQELPIQLSIEYVSPSSSAPHTPFLSMTPIIASDFAMRDGPQL